MGNSCHASNELKSNRKKLAIIIFLTSGYMIAEFIGGLFTNSLALLADAGHMLSDVAALVLSFFALWLANKPASPKKTYGYYRTEILATFINGVTLVGIAFYIMYEAYLRVLHPPDVKAPAMIAIATGGLVINLIGAWLLHDSSKKNLNIHGAFLHILGDLLGSVGTIVAGIIILLFNFHLADPIISFIISLMVLYSAKNLVMEASNVLLESTPSNIDIDKIREILKDLPSVKSVHDLHVWTISSQNIALSVHIVTEEKDYKMVLCQAYDLLKEKFCINHLTIQVEPPDFNVDDEFLPQ